MGRFGVALQVQVCSAGKQTSGARPSGRRQEKQTSRPATNELATIEPFRVEVALYSLAVRSDVALQPMQLCYSDGGPTIRVTSVGVGARGTFAQLERKATDLNLKYHF